MKFFATASEACLFVFRNSSHSSPCYPYCMEYSTAQFNCPVLGLNTVAFERWDLVHKINKAMHQAVQ